MPKKTDAALHLRRSRCSPPRCKPAKNHPEFIFNLLQYMQDEQTPNTRRSSGSLDVEAFWRHSQKPEQRGEDKGCETVRLKTQPWKTYFRCIRIGFSTRKGASRTARKPRCVFDKGPLATLDIFIFCWWPRRRRRRHTRLIVHDTSKPITEVF